MGFSKLMADFVPVLFLLNRNTKSQKGLGEGWGGGGSAPKAFYTVVPTF